MKVLLLGEYSGFYKNLYSGLKKLDVDVTWASNGDSWKKIGGASETIYKWDPNASKLSKFKMAGLDPLFDKRFFNYDIVQAVNPILFWSYINNIIVQRIIRHNNRFFVNAAGDDYFLFKAWENGKYYKYYIYDDNPELVSKWSGGIQSWFDIRSCKQIMAKADGIIPIIPYEYEVPYNNFSNKRKCILLPVNIDEIEYNENNIKNDKIVFFHGINRVKDKGSNYIIAAMKLIQEKYPNDVECIIANRMPYNQYWNAIKNANVIIDQCKGYGYGVNAIISMAKGKVVMSGAEKDMLNAGHLDNCPIINILPNVQQICNEMEKIIAKRKDIFPNVGFLGRQYVELNHNYLTIAKQYLDEWKK